MNVELALQNGTLVTESQVIKADLGITDGRIVAIAAPGSLRDAAETWDVTGLHVLPGAIDVHFHCRSPGYPERGDFASETRAAAAGGVTTVFEMPISVPGCATPEILVQRRRLGQENVYVNFGLFGSPGTLRPEDVYGMAEEGAIGFKIFMHRAPEGRAHEFVGLCITDMPELHEALRLVAQTGLRCTVHAENDPMLEAGIQRFKQAGRRDVPAHAESRPPVVEALAIAEVLTIAADVGAQIHIAHLSSAFGLQVLQRFQPDHPEFTAETCTPYLFRTEEDVVRVGPFGKINPPIRDKANQQALWDGLRNGSIAVVSTDHSPFLYQEKLAGKDNIWKAPSGAPGIEALVPCMMTAVAHEVISLPQAVRLIATRPAQLFDLYPQKGVIQIGADADLCLYDFQGEGVLDRQRMLTRAAASDYLFHGMVCQGRVVSTLLKGRPVYREGEITGKPGQGNL